MNNGVFKPSQSLPNYAHNVGAAAGRDTNDPHVLIDIFHRAGIKPGTPSWSDAARAAREAWASKPKGENGHA